MLDWEIKALENDLLDYEEWINHVKTVRKLNKGIEGDLMFPEPDKIIQNKINICFVRMVEDYEAVEGSFDEKLSDEEKVNIITSQEDYKNRSQKDTEID